LDDEDEMRGRVAQATADVELGTTLKAQEVLPMDDDADATEEEDDWVDEHWAAPLLRPNKGDVSNFATLFVFVVGVTLRACVGKDSAVASLVLAFGLFGFAGGITNWLAVKMLFDKIPLLVGSGVIPRRFQDILGALKAMILDTFFEEKFLKNYVDDRSESLLQSLDLKSRLQKGMSAEGFDAKLAEKLEKLAETPDGAFLATIGPMFGGFPAMVPMLKPMLVAVGLELLNSITDGVVISEMVDVKQVRAEIDLALESRMTTLTPRKVKRMMSRVIREHLGWLVVWGNVFGGLIGVLSWLAGY